MDISFCNLKNKDVVNICDGKNLGNITDIIIDSCCGKIIGLIVPSNKNFFSLFKSNNDIFIPYNRICKIGKDIILVDIIMHNDCCNDVFTASQQKQKNTQNSFNIQSIIKNINNDKMWIVFVLFVNLIYVLLLYHKILTFSRGILFYCIN